MKAPDKKYPLSVLDDLRASTLHFMSDKIYFDGVEYIRKDALLEWLEVIKAQSFELREKGYGDVFYSAQIAILEEVINKLNQM